MGRPSAQAAPPAEAVVVAAAVAAAELAVVVAAVAVAMAVAMGAVERGEVELAPGGLPAAVERAAVAAPGRARTRRPTVAPEWFAT